MVIEPTELVRKSYVAWAVEAYNKMREKYEKYDDYYDGLHKLEFSTQRWKQEFGKDFEGFADNWCQVVIDAPAHRMEVINWESMDQNKADINMAQQIWEESEVAEEEEDLILQTFIKGDAYLMVWPRTDDKGKPTETDSDGRPIVDYVFHDALEMCVHYDPADKRKIDRAAKRWEDEEGRLRLNLYFKDRIEQFTVPKDTSEAMQMGFIVVGEDLPHGWKRMETLPNPYDRVPVFHFKNRARGSTHGISELETVIPIQNACNKVLMDLMLGSEFAGFPQKWMAGGGHPPEGWRAGANRVWATTDPQAKFGQFDTMEFEGPLHFVELLVGHIAKTTQTPMYQLRMSGDMPSGEALKTADSGLVMKCNNRGKRWGKPFGDAMAFGIKIKTGEFPKSMIRPVWDTFEIRHDLEQAQTAQLKSILGVPLTQLWSEHFGYTKDQIDQFIKDNKQIAAAALAQLVAQAGQIAPGASGTLGELLGVEPGTSLEGLDIPQILALLNKAGAAKTTAGEATVRPQANTSPPASPTRRSTGFKD